MVYWYGEKIYEGTLDAMVQPGDVGDIWVSVDYNGSTWSTGTYVGTPPADISPNMQVYLVGRVLPDSTTESYTNIIRVEDRYV